MKKLFVGLILLLLVIPIFATALDADDARQGWRDAKTISQEKQVEHQDAKLDYAADPTEENNQLIVDTGKEVLYAALDEAEAWLIWKQLEAEENDDVPDEIKDDIENDVEANLAKIDELRTDVDNINTKFELGVTFLKMIGKYFELLSDVARNTGSMWVYIGEVRADKISDFEEKLRTTAEEIDDNEEIIEFLDLAREQLEDAEQNIAQADEEYEQVRIPGQPLIKFANGNNYLTVAKGNLLSAHSYLSQAYLLILSGGR
ncbi:MAG: hypothetical protein KKH52_03530 [Nanoarchaeota archaeon]|nr:hypothetical protein [Nanoarchaeota archaeon]MBU1974438.1 hypothetical protein [Nanoarchaeota archaeon]